jgi:cell division septation protein DedD
VENIKLDDATLSGEVNVPSLSTDNSAAISSRGETSQPAILEPAPLAAPIATSDLPAAGQPAAPSGGGSYFAYMGAFSSETAAKAHWEKLSKTYAGELSGYSPRFPKNGRLTGVAVGPMTKDQASKVCATVRTDCYSGKGS